MLIGMILPPSKNIAEGGLYFAERKTVKTLKAHASSLLIT